MLRDVAFWAKNSVGVRSRNPMPVMLRSVILSLSGSNSGGTEMDQVWA